MTALFGSGGISGHLHHYSSVENGYEDIPVLVLGFDSDGDALCIDANGSFSVRSSGSLVLDWRFVDGDWKRLDEIQLPGKEEPDADSEDDGSAD